MTLNQRKLHDAFGRVVATEHLYAQGASSGNPILTTHQDRWTNAFDDQQRLVATTSPTGFIRYLYDDFGRKKATESGTTGSTVLSEVTYAYDALSRLSTVLTVRRDGLPVDSNATLSDNQPEATRYHFDLLGRPDYTELPNGVVEDYVFDNMDRLDLMQHFQSDNNNADLTDNALKNMFDYSYRADGKRVGLVERFDTSGTGIRPGSSTLTNSYTWTYDNAGRLVSEVLDSSDNTLDQTESFLMDLVGNRIRRTLDKPGTANDTTDIYTYDASDRILNELRYSGLFATGNPTGSPTQTTTYTWNATQQTSKTVLNSSSLTPQVSSLFSYGLSGQLERVITTTQDGSGQITDRKQVEYRYDPQGIRFIASDYAYNNQTSTFTLQTSTEYLIDHSNFTGYQQTIIETTKNAAGQTTKRITYTYGLDEITQTTTAIDPASGLQSQVSSLTFAHDGHGSTRVLFEAAAVIAQIYTYSAYGELIALHNSLGSNLTSQASPLTSVLYNGESLDPTTGLYNFRARWYSAGNGRFERLDPFAGNPNDPFSFNKYGFVHGDPVEGIDPTGWALLSSFQRMILGGRVHTFLSNEFQSGATPGIRWGNRTVGTIVRDIYGPTMWWTSIFANRPDMAEWNGLTSGNVYELKSFSLMNPATWVTAAALARIEALGYVTELNFLTSSLFVSTPTNWSEGSGWMDGFHYWPSFTSSWMPNGYSLITFAHYSLNPGAILWDIIPTQDAWKLELQADAVGVVATLAILEWYGVTSLTTSLIVAGKSADGARLQGQLAFASLIAMMGFM